MRIISAGLTAAPGPLVGIPFQIVLCGAFRGLAERRCSGGLMTILFITGTGTGTGADVGKNIA
ncbi:hypothetical protein [Saccharopolyspora spinosa]|uniref:hypothetical protein n=1 Tax=Saccharopolyspora spinosa TaxID=60894 RepID=UPI000312F73A